MYYLWFGNECGILNQVDPGQTAELLLSFRNKTFLILRFIFACLTPFSPYRSFFCLPFYQIIFTTKPFLFVWNNRFVTRGYSIEIVYIFRFILYFLTQYMQWCERAKREKCKNSDFASIETKLAWFMNLTWS